MSWNLVRKCVLINCITRPSFNYLNQTICWRFAALQSPLLWTIFRFHFFFFQYNIELYFCFEIIWEVRICINFDLHVNSLFFDQPTFVYRNGPFRSYSECPEDFLVINSLCFVPWNIIITVKYFTVQFIRVSKCGEK